jgi:hypothetical protein
MTDWRLQGQERYLAGVRLYWRKYEDIRKEQNHDHCEFCWRKFSLAPEDLNEGYTTQDAYHWVCRDCFEDFGHLFRGV